MKITTKEIIRINKKLGGSLISDSSLSFAESRCRRIKSNYKKASIWVRAIVVDHPFSDVNKRTALYVIDKFIGVKNQRKMAKALYRIAKKNINSVNKIKEMLQNANRK